MFIQAVPTEESMTHDQAPVLVSSFGVGRISKQTSTCILDSM